MRGDFRGVPLVVSWEQYFARNLRGPSSYTRNVLDVFVAAPGVTFDGKAESKTLWSGFWSKIRGHRIQPFKHDLFSRYLISPEERGTTPSEVVDREFCARLYEHLQSFQAWEIQFQAGVGHSSLLIVPAKSLSTDRVCAVVESGLALYPSEAA